MIRDCMTYGKRGQTYLLFPGKGFARDYLNATTLSLCKRAFYQHVKSNHFRTQSLARVLCDKLCDN